MPAGESRLSDSDSERWPPELRHLAGLHDPFSAASHLFGAALFLVLGALLLRKGRGDPERLAYLAVYAAACVLLFGASGMFHAAAAGTDLRAFARRLDHAAIFVLIAASFTPGLGILFHGRERWGPLLLLWLAALAGVAVKMALFEAVGRSLDLTLYLGLGWLGVIPAITLYRRHGFRFIAPLLWGGIAYSIGGAMNLVRWPVLLPGVVHAHELFHLAVLAGALCHWLFIWRIADGHVPPRRTNTAPRC
jgi:channel protein (hemolysin III family)